MFDDGTVFNKMIPINSFTIICRSIFCVLNSFRQCSNKNKHIHSSVLFGVSKKKTDKWKMNIGSTKKLYTLHTLCARPFNRKSQTHLTHSTVGVVPNVYAFDVYMHSTTATTATAATTTTKDTKYRARIHLRLYRS